MYGPWWLPWLDLLIAAVFAGAAYFSFWAFYDYAQKLKFVRDPGLGQMTMGFALAFIWFVLALVAVCCFMKGIIEFLVN